MKLRKAWEVKLSDKENDVFYYTDQDYEETPELRKWLQGGNTPVIKKRVFILTH